MQNKFLRSIHFTVLSFAVTVAGPVPSLPSVSHCLPQGLGLGASPALVLPAGLCLPGLPADLIGLCFWQVGNFRHQCPDHIQEGIFNAEQRQSFHQHF